MSCPPHITPGRGRDAGSIAGVPITNEPSAASLGSAVQFDRVRIVPVRAQAACSRAARLWAGARRLSVFCRERIRVGRRWYRVDSNTVFFPSLSKDAPYRDVARPGDAVELARREEVA